METECISVSASAEQSATKKQPSLKPLNRGEILIPAGAEKEIKTMLTYPNIDVILNLQTRTANMKGKTMERILYLMERIEKLNSMISGCNKHNEKEIVV